MSLNSRERKNFVKISNPSTPKGDRQKKKEKEKERKGKRKKNHEENRTVKSLSIYW